MNDQTTGTEGYIGILEEQNCNCPGSISDNFLQPCVLLFLNREESYGYALIDQLKPFGIAPDASVLYRNLRKMEKDGLVESSWNTEGYGPAKRVYRLTPEGKEFLHIWAATVRQNRDQLDQFLRAYQEAFQKERSSEVTQKV